MNTPKTLWNEDALRERMQRAFATAGAETPSAIGRRALEAAKRNAHQRRSARRFGMASTLLAGAAVALLTWRSYAPAHHAQFNEGRAPAPIVSAPSHTPSRTEAKAAGVTSPVTFPLATRAERTPRVRTRSSTTARPSPADTERVARLQQAQAEDFQSAARLLEQAGQVEPAYQLYSLSIEAAPTLDATLGTARVLKKMDEETAGSDEGSPTSSSLRFGGPTAAG